MSALDIAPPSAPSVQGDQKGFFGKLFKKKEKEENVIPLPVDQLSSFEAEQSSEENFNLDDIRQKLGLTESKNAGEDLPHQTEIPAPSTTEMHTSNPSKVQIPEPPSQEPHDSPKFHEAPIQEEEPIAMETSAAPEPVTPVSEKPKKQETFNVDEWSEHDQEITKNSSSEWDTESATPPTDKITRAEQIVPSNEWAATEPSAAEPLDLPDFDEPAELPNTPEELSTPEHSFSETIPEESSTPEHSFSETIPEESEEQELLKARPIQEEAEAPTAEPSDPIKFDDLISEHFRDLEEEHKQLDKELHALVQHDDIPSADHPFDRKVAPGKEFVLKNGASLKSLRDLLDALEIIDEETFKYHVTEDKNDFAAWLQHVLEEERLAEQIRNQGAKKELLKILKSHEDTLTERFEDEESKIDEIIVRRKMKMDDADNIQVKLEGLQQQLREKSEELEEERKLVTKGIEERLNAEVDRQLSEERNTLHKERQEAVDTKREYEQKLEVMERAFEQKYEKREEHANEREEKLQAQQESLKNLEKTLNNERTEIENGRHEAEQLLIEAKKAEAEVKTINAEREKFEKEKEKFVAEKETFDEEKKVVMTTKTSVERQEKIVNTLRDKLNKREQEMTKQEAILKKELAEMKQAKSQLSKERKNAEAEHKKELNTIKNEQRKLEDRRKKAETAEAKLEEKLQERRKIAQYVEEAEQSIEEHEKRLSKGGMHNYLKAKLSDVGDAPAPESVRNLKIYTMIDQARQALSSDDTVEARSLYNKIRERFNKEELSSNEKQVLYTTIRELYDDIQMAGLK